MYGSNEAGGSHLEIGLRFHRAISPRTFIYLRFVFVVFHLHTEGPQNPPQLTWLDQTSLAHLNELKSFDNSFNVFENLCIKVIQEKSKDPVLKTKAVMEKKVKVFKCLFSNTMFSKTHSRRYYKMTCLWKKKNTLHLLNVFKAIFSVNGLSKFKKKQKKTLPDVRQ